MKRTPEEERVHAINLLDYQTKITETSSEIEVLQRTYEEQDLNTEICVSDIVTCINNEEQIMRNIRETSEVEIPKEIEESMQTMLIIKQREEERKKQLQSEIDATEHRLQEIMKRNALNERKLHDIAELERKYTDFLAKYDCDIGASYTLREKLLKDYEAIKAETKKMEDQLVIQRELYIRYNKEREIALRKAFTEKLEFFRRTRAAKIIQRTWKTYLERTSLKKRRKTKKK
ncbi:hypothetical protein X777_16615 [Ooceraea biroi]|uniref:Dynein regulatory complex protein 10 n=1 Tax=Ooceraea biroi TaxID=2015173 RepID=A0A026VU36_OOCBI|nr:hypothetical protein X777_16615 [Ooceraea biroi]